MSDADQFADTIEEIMMFIAIAKRAGRNGVDRMDGATPWLPRALAVQDRLNERSDRATPNGISDDEIVRLVVTAPPPPGDWVSKTLRPVSGEKGRASPFQFACELTRIVSPNECRGASAVYPVMAKSDVFALDKNAMPTQAISHFSGWTGKRWKYVGKHDSRVALERELHCGTSSITARVDGQKWHVKIAYEDSPSIKFSCSPTGAAEVFRLRDIPNGKSRRAALRNWVSAHYRKPIDDRNALIEVRKHLRGQTKFSWSGLRCEIVPAAADLRAVMEGEG